MYGQGYETRDNESDVLAAVDPRAGRQRNDHPDQVPQARRARSVFLFVAKGAFRERNVRRIRAMVGACRITYNHRQRSRELVKELSKLSLSEP